jgi:hypothetical protein
MRARLEAPPPPRRGGPWLRRHRRVPRPRWRRWDSKTGLLRPSNVTQSSGQRGRMRDRPCPAAGDLPQQTQLHWDRDSRRATPNAVEPRGQDATVWPVAPVPAVPRRQCSGARSARRVSYGIPVNPTSRSSRPSYGLAAWNVQECDRERPASAVGSTEAIDPLPGGPLRIESAGATKRTRRALAARATAWSSWAPSPLRVGRCPRRSSATRPRLAHGPAPNSPSERLRHGDGDELCLAWWIRPMMAIRVHSRSGGPELCSSSRTFPPSGPGLRRRVLSPPFKAHRGSKSLRQRT